MINQTKEFAVKIISRLEAEHAKWEAIKKLGFEKSDYEESLTDLLEESVARLLAGEDEVRLENILSSIQSWVYSTHERKLIYFDGQEGDVTSSAFFIDKLFHLYDVKQVLA